MCETGEGGNMDVADYPFSFSGGRVPTGCLQQISRKKSTKSQVSGVGGRNSESVGKVGERKSELSFMGRCFPKNKS